MKPRKRFTIGLTGGIATGKSEVLKIVSKLRVPIFSADTASHACLKLSHPAYRAIVRHFGYSILDSHQRIDRGMLGEIVFRHPAQRRWLEACIHPHVVREMALFIRKHSGLIVMDVPLLFEAKLSHQVDAVVVVASSQSAQIVRLRQRNGFSRSQSLLRIRSQWPLGKKRSLADYVIENNNSLFDLKMKTRDLFKQLKKMLDIIDVPCII